MQELHLIPCPALLDDFLATLAQCTGLRNRSYNGDRNRKNSDHAIGCNVIANAGVNPPTSDGRKCTLKSDTRVSKRSFKKKASVSGASICKPIIVPDQRTNPGQKDTPIRVELSCSAGDHKMKLMVSRVAMLSQTQSLYFRSDQGMVGGPKWTKMDLFSPQWPQNGPSWSILPLESSWE